MGLIDFAINSMRTGSSLMNFMLKMMRGTYKIRRYFRFKEKKLFKENEDTYWEKAERVYAAFKLKTPDRIPINGITGDTFPAIYSGYTGEDYLFNIEGRGLESHYNYINNFDFDLFMPTPLFAAGIGKILSTAGVKIIKLPGIDLDPTSFYQFDEREVMKDPQDYELFNKKYFNQKVLPAVTELACPKDERSNGVSLFKSLKLLMNYSYRLMHHIDRTEALGAPMIIGGAGMQPFDVASLLLRGLRKISIDMRRQPDDVKRICNKLAPGLLNMFKMVAKILRHERKIPNNVDIDADISLNQSINKFNPRMGAFFVCERAFMMNPTQFEEISLPSLNHVLNGLCEAEIIPILQFEQDVTHLLPSIRKLPGPGKCVFNCDCSDILKAKEILGDHMCIMGNVPLGLLTVGSPNDVEKYVKDLINKIGDEPGFIIGPALGIPGEAKPENVKALIDSAKKYGKLS
ncbi:MAG: hypothetical protein EU548_02905 [Promethearchaeota archaeon]|nr:MAG: hypothetical protein EU548_02905 [Candidatus Lokiarchaeota archaeon]